MTDFVLDNSVAMRWLLASEKFLIKSMPNKY